MTGRAAAGVLSPREPDAGIGAILAAVAEVRSDPSVAGLRAALHHLEGVPDIATLCAGVHQVLGEVLPARNFGVCLREEAAPNLQQAGLDFLRQHACDEIQGYLCARPMPAAELARRQAQRPRTVL